MFTAAGFAAGTGREPGPCASGAASRAAARRTLRGAAGSFECRAGFRRTATEARRRAGLATSVNPGSPDTGADG
jgi:hypothetical protein